MSDRQQSIRGSHHGIAAALRRLDKPHRIVLCLLRSHSQTVRRRQHLRRPLPANDGIRPQPFDLSREILRGAREPRPRRVQAMGRACQLRRGNFLGLSLHRTDQHAELLEHPVEAALQKPELVRVSALRPR